MFLSRLLELLRWAEGYLSFLVRLFATNKTFLVLHGELAWELVLEVGLIELRLHIVLLKWGSVLLIEIDIYLRRWRHLWVELHQRRWWTLISKIFRFKCLRHVNRLSGHVRRMIFRSNTNLRTQLKIRSKRNRRGRHRNLVAVCPRIIWLWYAGRPRNRSLQRAVLFENRCLLQVYCLLVINSTHSWVFVDIIGSLKVSILCSKVYKVPEIVLGFLEFCSQAYRFPLRSRWESTLVALR